ncbi:MAG: iron ABC transporter permease [Rhizobiaceae bacterium]
MIRRGNLWLYGLIILLAFLTVYPLTTLLFGSLHSTPPGLPGEYNLDGYAKVLSPRNLEVLWNSVAIAMAKTVISVTLAVAFAWIVARTDTPFRGTLEVLLTLPFFIPPIITATAWSLLGNPQVGIVNIAWRWLTGTDAPLINVYSFGGIIWHMVQHTVPFIFLLTVDAFRAMDPSLEESSRMSGASRTQTFFRITLVLMLPVVSSAFILSFMRGIEAFESPLFFGTPANIQVLVTEIYRAINVNAVPDYQYATAMAFSMMVFLFLLVVAQWRLLGGRSFVTVSGKGYSPGVMRLGRWRWVAFAACMLFFVLAVLLPLGQLLLGSFVRFVGFYQWDMFTLQNYVNVFKSREIWRAFSNTMILGVVGSTATMILGGIVAYVSVRTRWRGRRLIDALAWLPWMMPGMVLGIGLLWGYAILPGPIQLYGTIWALLLAYITLGTPLAVRIMSGSYQQLSFDLEESSRVHGASWWQTLWRILVALSWPAFAVGWTLTFFGIMRELSASVLLYSINTEVLSVVMLNLWSAGRQEEVMVIGLLTMLLVFVFRWVQLIAIRRHISSL